MPLYDWVNVASGHGYLDVLINMVQLLIRIDKWKKEKTFFARVFRGNNFLLSTKGFSLLKFEKYIFWRKHYFHVTILWSREDHSDDRDFGYTSRFVIQICNVFSFESMYSLLHHLGLVFLKWCIPKVWSKRW